MIRIFSIEELLKLKSNTKVYKFNQGNKKILIFSSVHPKTPTLAVLINDFDWSEAVTFSKNDFTNGEVWTGEYDSKTVGEILKGQLQQKIETIQSVYFK